MERRTFLRRALAWTGLAVTAPAVAAVPAGAASASDRTDNRANASSRRPGTDLWDVYRTHLQRAKYVSLSHVLTPNTPIWYGFDPTRTAFRPAVSGNASVKPVGEPFAYDTDGFEATEYLLPTDQFGTQLDPPAHWNPFYPAIDELPVAIALRPLVVISIVEQVADDFGYHLQVDDIRRWERTNGRIPAGSVVMVRSDWHKGWDDAEFVARTPFPGVGLDALKFLHEQRQILLHGHEPLDTDATPTLEGEAWLMNNGYLQAEGVANLDQVPETGALVTIGFPRFQGGTGGYASYVAICPPDWPFGTRPGELPEAPMRRFASPLAWDPAAGTRTRR